MVEVYDSHEQGERVKKWIQQNGGAVVLGLVIAFGGLFGFSQWQNWQDNKSKQASAEYQVLVELLEQDNMDAAVANLDTLRTNYGNSPYAAMAALQMAKARMLSGQPDISKQLYTYAMENGTPESIQLIARERLARIQLDLGEVDQALSTLNGATDLTGFEARYAEVRGDIQSAAGDLEAAAASYQEALDNLEENTGNRQLLELKLTDLGVNSNDTENES